MGVTQKSTLRRAHRHDRIARWFVTLGGMAVIASVIAILFLIAGTTLPLFRSARSELLASATLPSSLAVGDVVHTDVDASVMVREAM